MDVYFSFSFGTGLGDRATLAHGTSVIVILSAVLWLIRGMLRRSRERLLLPTITTRAKDFRLALEEGRRLYPNRAFVLPSEPPIVILPHEFINKLKSAPESELSANKEVYRRGLGQYTDLGTPMPEMFNAIKVDLTRHIRDLVPVLQEEAEYACEHSLGYQGYQNNEEWIEVTAFVFIKRIVTIMNAVAFVGRSLSRNTDWQEIAYNYSSDLRRAFDALNRWHSWTRPFVHPFIFRNIGFSTRRKRAAELLKSSMADAKHDSVDGGILLRFIRQRLGWMGRDSNRMARMQLRAALASSDTVSQALTNAVFDMLCTPGLVDSLRCEVSSVVFNNRDKAWDMGMLRRLSKLDSLLRESARIYAPFLVAMGRVTTSPLHLDDGTVVPRGMTTYFDMYHAHRSPEVQHDDEIAGFDGLRFSKRREQEHLPNKYLAATTGPDNLPFGHGTNSCPGRFFAVAEMKVVLAHLLLNYDMRLGFERRPETRYYGTAVMMDREAKVFIRKRRD